MRTYSSNAKLDRAYSQPEDLYSTQETNPLSSQHTSATVADTSSVTDGTYYYYIDMDDYRKLGLQIEITPGSGTVTVTIQGSLQDDGTAAGSCAYIECTYDTFNVVNTTTDDLWIDDAEKLAPFKYVRITAVHATGGSNDSGLTVYAKSLY